MPVVVAVAGWDRDAEMARRIQAHRASRPASWTTIRATPDPQWLARVPGSAVLLLDCLSTLVGAAAWEAVGEADVAPEGAEQAVSERVGRMIEGLIARRGDTVVVTNETGWGVVPDWASGRVFRDELGRANRRLVDAADAAYLVVSGRAVDLKALPGELTWPDTE